VRSNPDLSSRRASENRLILIFVATSIVATLLIISQIFSAREQAVHDIKKTLLNYSLVAENMLSASLQRVDDTLLSMSIELGHHPERMNPKYLQKLLLERQVHSDIPGLAFRIINFKGVSVTGTNDVDAGRPHSRVSFLDRSYFRSLSSGAPLALSEPLKSKSLNRWQVVLARRITSKNGEFLGSMGAAIDVEYLAKIKDTFNLGPDDIFAMASGLDPKMLARFPELRGVIGAPFKYHQNLSAVALGKEHSGVYDTVSPFDGMHRFTSMTRVSKFPLIVITGRGLDAQLAPWRERSTILILVLATTIAVGGFMVWQFIRGNRLLNEHQLKLVSSSKMALLGEMAGGVAHEINNPLAIVHGRAYELRKMAKSGIIDLERFARAAENIEATAMRMAKITRGLKFFAREGDKDPFNSVPLKTIIDDTLGFCDARFKHHKIKLHIPEIPEVLKIECRSVQISQLLLNLLGNAFDAVETLEQKWVAIDVKDLGTSIEIAVKDSGKGIPAEFREKILQPFFTTKEIGKGTGLGLSISKGIVESHHGEFFVDEYCENTRFVINLPKRQPGATTAPLPSFGPKPDAAAPL
jgi:signal transduction histidine kinase